MSSDIEITETQLKGIIADAVEPIKRQMLDLEARSADLVPEPDRHGRQRTKSFEERCEEFQREHHAKLKKNPSAFHLPPENEFSLVRYLRAQCDHDWKHAPYEKWCVNQTQTKATPLSYGTTTAGGYLVAAEYLPQEFVEYLHAAQVLRRAGARVIPCTGSPVNIPALTTSGTAYWVAENAALTASSQAFEQVQLTPKWCIGRTQLSEFLVNSSAPAAESIVRQDLASVIGVEVDKQCLIGTGTTNKPLGITATDAPGTMNEINSLGTNGGAFTLAAAHEMIYTLEYDNVPLDSCVWIMHPRTWNAVRQLQTINYSAQTVGGDYYLRPDVSQAEARTLLGFPVYTTTNMPINLTKASGTALAGIAFVRMNDVLIGEWGSIDIRVTDIGGDAWAKNMIEVKATVTLDVDMRRAESICYCDESSS